MSLSALAALLESEHDLLSVLLVRAERLADNDDERLRSAIQVVREELSDLELRRALLVSGIAERMGLGQSPTLGDLIARASGFDRMALAAAQHDLVFLLPQVDDAGRSSGLGTLTPPSLNDFLHRPA